MTPPSDVDDPRRRRRRTLALSALGLASTVAFTALAVRGLRVWDVARSLERAALWPWVPLGLAWYGASHVLRGVRCRLLVSREAKLSLLDAVNAVLVGHAANNVLPVRLGEFVRAGTLAERTGLPPVQTLAVVFVERVFDGLALLLMLVLAEALSPTLVGIATRQLTVALFLAAAAGVMFLAVGHGWALAVAGRVSALLRPSWRDAVMRGVTHVISGTSYLREGPGMLRVAAASAVIWACEAAMFLSLLPALGVPAAPGRALLAAAVTNLGIILPSTPGFIGPFHYFCQQALVDSGVAADVALAYAVLVHLVVYLSTTAWGFGVLLLYGRGFRARLALRQRARVVETGDLSRATPIGRYYLPSVEPRPDRFLIAVVDGLIPFDESGSARADGIARAAAFTAGQLSALPRRFRVALHLGLAGFRAASFLRFGRDLPSVRADRAHAWVEHWAYGPFSVFRLLFRAVRSVAVLAYLEHQAARTVGPGLVVPAPAVRHD